MLLPEKPIFFIWGIIILKKGKIDNLAREKYHAQNYNV